MALIILIKNKVKINISTGWYPYKTKGEILDDMKKLKFWQSNSSGILFIESVLNLIKWSTKGI